ncbi:MAG TPA: FCD domain-containing protein [Conexibacter sp.]|nr:FCD domain-containing protein [Conexibacter sp.]
MSAERPDDQPFTAVRRVRSFDEVLLQVQEAIATGRFRPGERLPSERALCDLFDVSRPTLREALRALEALGTLTVRVGKGGGTFVAEPSGDSVGSALAALIRMRGANATELHEFRTSFEGETAAWAARRATPEDVAALDRIAAAVQGAASDARTPWREIVALDIAFHETVAQASKNRVRVAVMLGLLRAVERVELSISELADAALQRTAGDQLSEIATAIREHDAERARTAMSAHVERFSELYARTEQ